MRVHSLTIVALALSLSALINCSSDSSNNAAAAKNCGGDTQTCQAEKDREACLAQKCASQRKTAETACAAVIQCEAQCGCNDTSCSLNCVQTKADAKCQEAFQALDTCETNSGCPDGACADGGSGAAGFGGGLPDSGTGNPDTGAAGGGEGGAAGGGEGGAAGGGQGDSCQKLAACCATMQEGMLKTGCNQAVTANDAGVCANAFIAFQCK